MGDCCKAIASRVRGAVASEPFDNFHRNSAKIIRASVFGRNSEGKVMFLETLFFFFSFHFVD